MSQTPIKPSRKSPPGIPRWVKVFAIITFALTLLILIALATGLGGPHGPGRHILPSDPGGSILPLENDGQQL